MSRTEQSFTGETHSHYNQPIAAPIQNLVGIHHEEKQIISANEIFSQTEEHFM